MKLATVLAPLFALSLVLSGCTSEAAATVAGTYELDKNATIDAMVASMDPKPDQAAIDGMKSGMSAMLPAMTLILEKDKTARFTQAGQPEEKGSFEVEGDTIKVKAKQGDKEVEKTGKISAGKLVFTETMEGKTMQMHFVKK